MLRRLSLALGTAIMASVAVTHTNALLRERFLDAQAGAPQDEYMALIADTAGPIALALGGLSEAGRGEVRAEVEDSLGRFTAGDGYGVVGPPPRPSPAARAHPTLHGGGAGPCSLKDRTSGHMV